MKRFLFVLLFISFSSYAVAFDGKLLIGFWKLVKSQDMSTKETYKPDKSIYYHFHKDKTLIMTDTYTRERSEWDWKLSSDKLVLVSQLDDISISGNVSFLSDGSLRYRVDSLNNASYVWIFEKFD